MDNIKVTLVDLSSHTEVADRSDEGNEEFQELLDVALASCTTAETSLARELDVGRPSSFCCRMPFPSFRDEGTDETGTQLKNKILRYVRRSDKYIALTSLLLKSRAYYTAYPVEDCEDAGELPIVDLPRTQTGKPFIPSDVVGINCQDPLVEVYPFSVSHQFPFVGIAQLETQQTGLQVGMDIVVFDKGNKALYDSTEDFVNVFRDSFTEWEWSQINKHRSVDEDLLIEFYLRWAMKEAYTKALGLGMSATFSTFETRIHGIDHQIGLGLWPSIVDGNGKVFRGSVEWDKEKDKNHVWDFFFLPLGSQGCSCICVGPSRSISDCGAQPSIEWVSLRQLIEFRGAHYRDQLEI